MGEKGDVSPCRGCANEKKSKNKCLNICLALANFNKNKKWKPNERAVVQVMMK